MQGGIAGNAEAIAQALIGMNTTIRFQLAAEYAMLCPALRSATTPTAAERGRRYRDEMQGVGVSYAEFSREWRVGSQTTVAPEQFRSEANAVFKALNGRIQREDCELYPASKAL